MKSLLLGLGLMLTITSVGQDFHRHIQKADSAYRAESYSESIALYEEAFTMGEGDAGQYYNASCSAALGGQPAMAVRWLYMSVEKGWHNVDWAKKDSDLFSLHVTEDWSAIIQQMAENLKEYEKDFDQELKAQLEAIYIRDQTLRQLYREAEDKFGSDSEEMSYFWTLVMREDSMNEAEVVKIIAEYGWPGSSLVGGKANAAVWLVIQHAPLAVQEKHLPLLRQSVLEGESRGSDLALLQDRIQMRNGQPQTYGSQIVPDPNGNGSIVYEIHEPEYVNQRRKEVGLGPIEDYLARWDIEWEVEQKAK